MGQVSHGISTALTSIVSRDSSLYYFMYICSGPIEEAVNGQSPLPSPVSSSIPSPTTTQIPHNATLPQHAPVPSNVSANEKRPTTPQGGASRRSKVGEKAQPASNVSNPSKVAKPTERHGRATTSATTTRTGLPSSRKNHLTQVKG